MLRHGGIAYVDKGYTWEEWHAAKASQGFPFDRLPALDVGDGRRLAESGALARLIARWAGARAACKFWWVPRRGDSSLRLPRCAGLYPADAVAAAAVDMVHQAANDLEQVEPIFNVRATASGSAVALTVTSGVAPQGACPREIRLTRRGWLPRRASSPRRAPTGRKRAPRCERGDVLLSPRRGVQGA